MGPDPSPHSASPPLRSPGAPSIPLRVSVETSVSSQQVGGGCYRPGYRRYFQLLRASCPSSPGVKTPFILRKHQLSPGSCGDPHLALAPFFQLDSRCAHSEPQNTTVLENGRQDGLEIQNPPSSPENDGRTQNQCPAQREAQPQPGRAERVFALRYWTALTPNLCIPSGLWEGGNTNFTVEKPDGRHLNRVRDAG